MARIELFLFALLASLVVVLASPVPVHDIQVLEKRVQHTGRGTWFHPGLGNCGEWNNDNDPIVAMGQAFYNRNQGSNCNQWMQIVNTANGKTAYAKTVDSCESCGDNDIDMSPAVFQQLAPLSQGQITVTWHFQPK